MPMWPVYLIIAYLLYHYGLPLIAVLRGLRRTAAEFQHLDPKRFRVLRNIIQLSKESQSALRHKDNARQVSSGASG